MSQMSKKQWFGTHGQLYEKQIKNIKFAGLWPPDENCLPVLHVLYFIYNKFMLTIMWIFITTIFADLCLGDNDLTTTTEDACNFAGTFVIVFKAINYQRRREKISRLIDRTIKCGNELCNAATGNIESLIRKYELRNIVSFYGFNILGFCLVVALMFFAPVQNGSLPIKAKYPFDTKDLPWRQIAFTVEIFAVGGGIAGIVGMDCVMVMECNMITLQLDILYKCFENCRSQMAEPQNKRKFPNARSYDPGDYKKNGCFIIRYKRCLEFHQRLVFLVNDFNETFSSSMFAQILSSTSMICMASFQVVVVGGDNSSILKFGIFLSAAVTQLLYVCWVGNELTYSSSLLSKSQWLSDWNYEPFSKISRLLILSTMFSKQPLKVSAMYYTMSFQTFIAIIRGSYSFFTLLNTMHTSDKP